MGAVNFSDGTRSPEGITVWVDALLCSGCRDDRLGELSVVVMRERAALSVALMGGLGGGSLVGALVALVFC